MASAEDSNIIFLPYLSGERSPHNDVNARGAFIGLAANTTRAQMSRAVMEGVAFALRDCLEVAKAGGVAPTESTLCGGGAKSKIWRGIIADALGIPVKILKTEQGPSFGGAILAMVGAGEYASVEEAADAILETAETVYPTEEGKARMNAKYEVFKKLYPALKEVM